MVERLWSRRSEEMGTQNQNLSAGTSESSESAESAQALRRPTPARNEGPKGLSIQGAEEPGGVDAEEAGGEEMSLSAMAHAFELEDWMQKGEGAEGQGASGRESQGVQGLKSQGTGQLADEHSGELGHGGAKGLTKETDSEPSVSQVRWDCSRGPERPEGQGAEARHSQVSRVELTEEQRSQRHDAYTNAIEGLRGHRTGTEELSRARSLGARVATGTEELKGIRIRGVRGKRNGRHPAEGLGVSLSDLAFSIDMGSGILEKFEGFGGLEVEELRPRGMSWGG
mmetsp:Transcript_22691/g.35513  ORF Transcript_22691/g.35513 Transcript_22691/m.35513 type:complete len:283 (+) Transcript_22691:519-1367(+)